jgi:thiol-disulfide isomerase/thioredoxin
LDEVTLASLLDYAKVLEANDSSVTSELFDKINTAFADHEDAQITDQLEQALAQREKRMAIVGQPFTVEGVQLDGTAFDWSQYRGKLVMVVFWATTDQLCLQQMPGLIQIYDRFQSRGLEVVGVNFDEDPARLQQFLSLQPLPWKTVVSADPDARSLANHPLAQKCGVETLPFLVLVDGAGKAVALNPRGDQLETKLDELLASESS